MEAIMAENPREALERLIQERGEDYVGLSRLIGRNAAYIQQFMKRGTPRRLAEDDRRRLARYFGVDESVLGGPPHSPLDSFLPVPRLDVGASAGAGALDPTEQAIGSIAFDPGWLRGLGIADTGRLSMIRVEGDSMAPTLADDDEILVDGGDAGSRLRSGLYVLRVEDALVVKRIAPGPGGRVSVLSDNPAYSSWPDSEADTIDIVGRVVWVGRRLA
jgi:phage repressor protein C with HTH and peptisase S24 domain